MFAGGSGISLVLCIPTEGGGIQQLKGRFLLASIYEVSF